jgi:vacuolar-type H+-ATPase subunit F/Vma7
MENEIVVIGSSAFVAGFALAGVRRTELASAQTVLATLQHHMDAGLIILEEELMAPLPPSRRQEIETSIRPVIIPLSRDAAAQTRRLRSAVINTLGVDLLR